MHVRNCLLKMVCLKIPIVTLCAIILLSLYSPDKCKTEGCADKGEDELDGYCQNCHDKKNGK